MQDGQVIDTFNCELINFKMIFPALRARNAAFHANEFPPVINLLMNMR